MQIHSKSTIVSSITELISVMGLSTGVIRAAICNLPKLRWFATGLLYSR
jgi:hypothetical protein